MYPYSRPFPKALTLGILYSWHFQMNYENMNCKTKTIKSEFKSSMLNLKIGQLNSYHVNHLEAS